MNSQQYTFSKTRGFSLAELIIALTLLGIIAAFAIPTLLQSPGVRVSNAKNKAAAEMMLNALLTANGESGLLPVSRGPGKALQPYLKGKNFDIPNYADVPQECKNLPKQDGVDVVQAGDYHVKLANGVDVYGLNPTWNTGVTDEKNQVIDPVCSLAE